MKTISKITVKHFLNTTLGSSSGIVGFYNEKGEYEKSQPAYPLYVKIIFMRKTTQMKSSVGSFNEYETLEEAFKDLGDKLASEIRMIEDIITNEYKKFGNKFELKGIGNKCNKYQKDLNNLLFEQYLWQDFFKVLSRTNSEYKRLLLARVPKTPVIKHYHAALKLLENNEALLDLKEQFENYTIMEKCLTKNRKSRHCVSLFDWAYGKERDGFSYVALKNGISFNKVAQLVGIIDTIISNHIKQL